MKKTKYLKTWRAVEHPYCSPLPPLWTTPVLGNDLSGVTLQFTYPSDEPLQMTGWGYYNNTYITTTSGLLCREAIMVDYVDAAEDYSWIIQTYTDTITIGDITVYESVTTVKEEDGVETIQSVVENIRKETITMPDDAGICVSFGGSIFGVMPHVDARTITTHEYTLTPLSKTDVVSDGLILMSSFPTDIDTTWFPTIPSADEYGNITLDDKYTLFAEEVSYTPEGQEYETMYLTGYSAFIDANGSYDEDWNFVPDGTYGFGIRAYNDMMNTELLCYKTYGASTTSQWNNVWMTAVDKDASATLTTLNTSSPLYPYVKKVVWK